MGARHFTELDAWKLAVQLRGQVFDMTSTAQVRADRDFWDDIRRAARSAPNNIAEGFGRFRPREFRRFLKIARGSVNEVQNRLLEGRQLGYWTEGGFADAWTSSRRTAAAIASLMRYLRSDRAQRWTEPNRPKAPERTADRTQRRSPASDSDSDRNADGDDDDDDRISKSLRTLDRSTLNLRTLRTFEPPNLG